MDVLIQLDLGGLKEAAQKSALDSAKSLVVSKLRDAFYFSGKSDHPNNGTTTKLILGIVDETIASQEFADEIKRLTLAQIDHSMKTAIHNAVDKVIRREAHKKADAIINEMRLTPHSAVCPFCGIDCQSSFGPSLQQAIAAHKGEFHRVADGCGATVMFPWAADTCQIGNFCAQRDHKDVLGFIGRHGKLG